MGHRALRGAAARSPASPAACLLPSCLSLEPAPWPGTPRPGPWALGQAALPIWGTVLFHSDPLASQLLLRGTRSLASVPDGGASLGLGGLVCPSLHRLAPALFSNEHAAKISIKLPETLKFPPRLHNRHGGGSQLMGVTMLSEGVFLGSQVVNRVL